MDPITAIAIATSAFKAIKTGFSVGRDMESMGSDLSRWMGAIGDVKDADQKARNPSIVKSYFSKGSVEKEAIEAFSAKKKAIEMENELKSFINMTYGPSAWKQLLQIQVDIRLNRAKEKELQKEFQQMITNIFLGIGIFLIVVVIAYFTIINI